MTDTNPFANIDIPSDEDIYAPTPSVKKSPVCVKTDRQIISAEGRNTMTSTATTLYERLGLLYSPEKLWWNPKAKQGEGGKAFSRKTDAQIAEGFSTERSPGQNATLLYAKNRFMLIDIDDHTKPEAGWLKEKCDEVCNMIQQTRKGFHYMFQFHANIKSSTNQKCGFDIRTDNDVLLCEPTTYIHPTDGACKYEWVKRPSEDEGLIECPAHIIKFLVEHDVGRDAPIPRKTKPIAPPSSPTSSTEDDEEPNYEAMMTQTPRRIEGVEELERLASMLTPEWLTDVSNWVKFAYSIKTLANNDEGLQLFLAHSARAPGFETPAHRISNTKFWKSLKPNGRISIGALKHWAKKCSPDRYFAEAKDTYMGLVKQGTQTAFCELFYNEMAGDIIYSNAHKRFYIYDSREGLWRGTDNNAIINFQFVEMTTDVIRKMMAALPPAATEEQQERRKADTKLLAKALKDCDSKATTMVSSFLPALCRTDTDPANYFNQNPDLLPLKNGVWKFSEKRLIPYEREHYFTFRIPIAYNPRADTKDIRRAVNDWFRGDEAVGKFIQYYIGYCMTGFTKRQDFIINWGTKAGNGKSLLWGTIMRILLGDPEDTNNSYYHTITSDALSTERVGNNDQLYYLNGKRFAFLSEPRRTAKTQIDNEMLKNLTGDATFTAEAKYKNAITFKLSAKFGMACNDMPDLKFDDRGTYRRVLIAEQNVEFMDADAYEAMPQTLKDANAVKPKDEDFINRLLENTEGLMLWALEGSNAFIDDPHKEAPPAMAAAKSKAQTETDTLGTWITGNIRNLKTVEGGETKTITLAKLKSLWAEKKLAFGQTTKGFNKSFCDKCKRLGYEVIEGRVGKSEEKLKYAEIIPDEEEEE
jgi:P4 family phage/plasmid primase-like protien